MPYPSMGCASCAGGVGLGAPCSSAIAAPEPVTLTAPNTIALPRGLVWGAVVLLVVLALNNGRR